MKNSTRNRINLVFSSFLVIGYIICTYFFSSLAAQVDVVLGNVIQVAMLVLFGLLMFYATRVGDGRQVKRFSLAVLLMVVLPCVVIIALSLIQVTATEGLLHDINYGLKSRPIVMMLACVALGYGIPYTFFSGYEIKEETEEEAADEAVIEGGLAEELAEAEADAEDIADAQEKAELEEAAEAEAQAAIELQEIEE